ncbi:GSCOCT00013992001.2-RA-CDS [Cotesia congregata]|uniref:Beta 1.3 glucan-binding protein1 like_Tollpathway_Cc n=1 Tax=Cotesia congregata TaxID=51543 RepID=A0A8J2HFL4_COTCN|nr:GSCOCT00013992001.2-RA-CDS [Cotesia congregata]CAG5097945.1 beta 1.3 glucan-binding protein1 like_Tollpathway_Cc [Cotesia congregata]
MSSVLVLIISLAIINYSDGRYTPPQAKVEPLYPKGIRISIPDEKGISLVAFHIKFNEEFEGIEAGTIARDILRVKNGRWAYEDHTTELTFGDTVYYWVHVVYEGLGYNLLFQEHKVNAFFNKDGTRANVNNPVVDQTQHCTPSASKLYDSVGKTYQEACQGQLIFEDHFELFNTSKWRAVERFTSAPDYAFVVYRNNEKNIKVNEGKLNLCPMLIESEFGRDFIRHGSLNLEMCTEEMDSSDCKREARGAYILPPVSSGYVDTKKSFSFVYGKIEVRAKLPKGDWIYPIISLEPLQDAEAMSYPQLRVAASLGNTVIVSSGGADLSGHLLTAGKIQRNDGQGLLDQRVGSLELPKRFAANYWSDEYHIYQLEWTSSKITVKVDNVEYGTMDTNPAFDRPFYIALAVAVGGHEEFPDGTVSNGYSKPWRNVGSKILGIILINVSLINATIWTLIHDSIQNNIAGIPTVHQHTEWDFNPEHGKARRAQYEALNGPLGKDLIDRLGNGMNNFNGPWGLKVSKLKPNLRYS